MTETLNLTGLLSHVADLSEAGTGEATDHHSKLLATIVAILLETPSSHRERTPPQPFRNPNRTDGENFGAGAAMATYISEFGLLETLDCLSTAPDLLNCTMKDAAGKLLLIQRAILLQNAPDDRAR
ncbi:hypothetical protein [Rhizobium mesoamericanum]|uniref:hypothetical protein n=1 Tax=Rhizobium mesoamericanum TaxID=1079800 RepID=UPI00041A63CB|nr:hypothetical protein [Rhizobium mesoamericanum]